MQEDLVHQGLQLMLYGMGTVVLFLTALVAATTLMSRGINRFFPEPVVQARPAVQPAAVDEDPNLVAVIGAEVHRYRGDRQ